MCRKLPDRACKKARTVEDQLSKEPDYESEQYYLYLESFDQSSTEPDNYTLTFECFPVEVMLSFLEHNAPQFQLFDNTTLLFTWEDATSQQLIDILDPRPSLTTWESNYFEGSWYLADLIITKSIDDNNKTHMVHIDSFVKDPDTQVYNVEPKRLKLLLFPGTADMRPRGDVIYYATDTGPRLKYNRIPAKFGFDVYYIVDKRLIHGGFKSAGEAPSTETLLLRSGVTVAGDITSIGIMDLGIAGCNLLIATDDPVYYFDAGSPLPAFNKTFPPTFTTPVYKLPVILSHWDWDHWSLVLRKGCESLKDVVWHVNKSSPLGGKAAAFKAGQKAAGKLLEFIDVKKGIRNIEIHLSSTSRKSGGFAKNNTGLAVLVKDIVLSRKQGHVVMTGDANFNSANLTDTIHVIGITAVHHGSKNEGASNHLPKPRAIDKKTGIAEEFQGRIVYAYGMRNAGANTAWKRPYNFPAEVAVTNYRAAKWGKYPPSKNEMSTAEGTLLNKTPRPKTATEQPPNRGNIRMGDQTALKPIYNTSSFYPIKHKLQ